MWSFGGGARERIGEPFMQEVQPVSYKLTEISFTNALLLGKVLGNGRYLRSHTEKIGKKLNKIIGG